MKHKLTARQMKRAPEVAAAFCRIIRAWLTPDELREAIRRNKTAEYASCCASHDYCDANVAMDDAFKEVFRFSACDTGGEGQGCMSDDAIALWNEAWTLAKASKFSLGAISGRKAGAK